MLTLTIQCRYQHYGMFIAKKDILIEGFITHSEEIFVRELFPALKRSLANNALSLTDFSALFFEGHSLSGLAALRGLGLALGLNPVVRFSKENDAVPDGYDAFTCHRFGGYEGG